MSFDWANHEEEDDCPDPGAAPVAIDANALERNGKRDTDVDRFLDLIAAGRVDLHIGPGIAAELLRDKYPISLGAALLSARDRPSPSRPLTAAQHIARIRVRAIVCGNAKPGKHDADAAHLSEAAEAGCGYFITYDGRILRKRDDLESLALPGLNVVTLEEFLAIIDRLETMPPRRR